MPTVCADLRGKLLFVFGLRVDERVRGQGVGKLLMVRKHWVVVAEGGDGGGRGAGRPANGPRGTCGKSCSAASGALEQLLIRHIWHHV